ncbi:HDOD domain-containing protein [Aquabacterium sp.]|uniref:HDOD domain-containing protein n=1 Tax=Aquabacterium sp. TaxID=1872578 RepID=UPI0024872185|nr:HDOD domain-containing protein [Aquabacterium sp.]MDI1261568.1 HDOD domain-containing protein [Aquabacterium sp.]
MASKVSHFFPFSLVLPNMPGVAAQLIRSMNDDSMSLPALAELIGKDPSLSATVLRIANTARYSPLRSVSSLREATATLGMTTLRNLALGTCMAKAFPAVAGLDRRRFWCRGIATAHYAGLVGRATLVDPEIAYLGGLMLQTGQLLMMQIDKTGVADVESQILHPGDRFRLEQQRWHCTHSDVTAELARRWKFPDTLLVAFETVSYPLDSQPFSNLGAVLHVAALLADALVLEASPVEALEQSVPQLVARLHLNLDWLQDKLLTVADLAPEVDSMVG